MIRSISPLALLGFLAGIGFGFPESCRAQSTSLFGSGGALSATSSSTGNNTATYGANGMSGGTGSASFGSGGGTAGGGRGGASAGQTGQTGAMQSSMNAGDGSLGATIGTSGFVGRGDTSGRFIGSQNAGQQGRGQSSQLFSQLQSLAKTSQNSSNSSNSSNVPQIRPRLQLGFQPSLTTAEMLQATLQSRLLDLPVIDARAKGVAMAVDAAGQVTLSGSVATEEDRRMMEILTRMEPGVRNVRNELIIVP